MLLKYIVDEESAGKNAKYILKNKLELSERLVKRLKYGGKIFQNGTPIHVNAIVTPGDVIEAFVDFEEDCSDIIPENIPIDIIYEDDYMIVLNKQPNIVVHPTSTHLSGTIANAIMHHYSSKAILKKIRPVSRLDRDTSGIIIFAKNEYVQEVLIRQMKDNTFSKEYVGVVYGNVSPAKGTIALPISRKPESIMVRQVSPEGQGAITHYEVLEYFAHATYMKFLLETGRTHQIRVHCQATGHPLIGDTLYPPLAPTDNEDFSALIGRQALHSYRVSFIHPVHRTEMTLTAAIPKDINELLEILRK